MVAFRLALRLKIYSCSTQWSNKIFLLINVTMPTIVCISTFMSKENNILGLSEPENAKSCFLIFYILVRALLR